MLRFTLYGLFVILSLIVYYKVSQYVKHPFIDEIFHLRQCNVYCEYKFDIWDDKITTPPGLYYLGFMYAKVISLISGYRIDQICSNYDILRSVNLMGGLVVLPIIVLLHNHKIWPVNIISLPLLVPYYFLFYTDIWSLIFIIGSLTLISRSTIMSGILGFISLWFRQTNIIWIAFIASLYIDQFINPKSLFSYLQDYVITTCQRIIYLIPYLINFLLFGIFLNINGGITLGDKENHQIQIHLVQIFYAISFINFFTWPMWLSSDKLKKYVRSLIGTPNNFFIKIPMNLLACYVIHYIILNFTIVHPFLLADNRHYTFYIWKKILSHKYSLYFTIPVYHFGTWNIIHSLYEAKVSIIIIISFIISNLLTIVPSPLFEPRYYITPLVIFRILINKECKVRNIIEFMWSGLINVVIMYIFINYEFTWESEIGIQRIIW